jgi:hypothetical protein
MCRALLILSTYVHMYFEFLKSHEHHRFAHNEFCLLQDKCQAFYVILLGPI